MRDWWLRTFLVLQRPRPVFVALRDDSKASLGDRSEPILAIVLLAGIAAVLSTSAAGKLMDDATYDAVLVAVWAFIAGSIYGIFGYFVFGALLHAGGKALGSQGSYRRARHVLAFAAVPIALSFFLWPVKLAVFGESVFRTGGSDHGAGIDAFDAVEVALLVWAAVLLVIGVRAVHGWTWARAGAACVLALMAPAVVGFVFAVV
jgi:Yip1 domain